MASWRDRAEYGLARSVEAVVSSLPVASAERAGRALGLLVRSPLGVRRAVVEQNLRRAFPEAEEGWIRSVVREAYAHLGRETVATLRLAELSPQEIVARTEMRGWEGFVSALGEGRGAIVVTGHFGNWEVGAAAIAARGVGIDAVMKRLRNPLLDARLDRTRRRLGMGTIEMRSAPARVPRALAAGRVVGMVADQDARHTGVWVPFLGHLASTHRGPALFALRLGAPLFASAVYRLPSGRYLVSLERVEVRRTADLEADIVSLTRAWTERLERAVREAPGQYFWFHKRWKTRPPAELAALPTGTILAEHGDPDRRAADPSA